MRIIKVNELTLVGVSRHVETKKPNNGVFFKVGDFELELQKKSPLYMWNHFTPPTTTKGVANKLPWVAPFWAVVASSADKERATEQLGGKAPKVVVNMVLKYVDAKVCEDLIVRVPVLVNNIAMKSGDKLYWNTKEAKDEKPKGAKRQRKE